MDKDKAAELLKKNIEEKESAANWRINISYDRGSFWEFEVSSADSSIHGIYEVSKTTSAVRKVS